MSIVQFVLLPFSLFLIFVFLCSLLAFLFGWLLPFFPAQYCSSCKERDGAIALLWWPMRPLVQLLGGPREPPLTRDMSALQIFVALILLISAFAVFVISIIALVLGFNRPPLLSNLTQEAKIAGVTLGLLTGVYVIKFATSRTVLWCRTCEWLKKNPQRSS